LNFVFVWNLEFGAWDLFGAWCLVLGAWCLVLGAWCLEFGIYMGSTNRTSVPRAFPFSLFRAILMSLYEKRVILNN